MNLLRSMFRGSMSALRTQIQVAIFNIKTKHKDGIQNTTYAIVSFASKDLNLSVPPTLVLLNFTQFIHLNTLHVYKL